MPEYLAKVYLICIVSSVTFGVVGAFVVARRIGYLAGAISHAAFGGVGIGLWLKQGVAAGAFGALALARICSGKDSDYLAICRSVSEAFDPVFFALIFAVFSAILIDLIRRRASERQETLLGAIWAIGMAVGLFFLERVHDYVSPTTFLFGDVLLVTWLDVAMAAILGAAILAIVFFDFKRLEAVCFDEEFARLRGINIGMQNRLLLILTSVSVVLLLRVVGMAMVVALLTLPAAAAARFAKRLSGTMIGASLVCLVGSILGVWLSFGLNASTGPTIILVIALFYALSLPFGRRD